MPFKIPNFQMKKIALVIIIVALFAFAINPIKAEGEATGTIRISPALPIMTESPANFEIWVQGAGDPTYNPHILLVMTYESWDGLTDDIVVGWDGDSISFAKGGFTMADNGYVPPSGTTNGTRYTIASLKDHLGTDGPVYWAMDAFLDGPLHTSPHKTFTVTLPSTEPRMLVYALGKTYACPFTLGIQTEISPFCNGLFNNKVPPTIPGFVVPEPSTILLALSSFSAFALYAFKRRRL